MYSVCSLQLDVRILYVLRAEAKKGGLGSRDEILQANVGGRDIRCVVNTKQQIALSCLQCLDGAVRDNQAPKVQVSIGPTDFLHCYYCVQFP